MEPKGSQDRSMVGAAVLVAPINPAFGEDSAASANKNDSNRNNSNKKYRNNDCDKNNEGV